MAQRRHHYDAAFEHYLRANRVPYVSVDEARRALLPDQARLRLDVQFADRRNGSADKTSAQPPPSGAVGLKSFDFLVYAQAGNWLVDVKGRKVPRRLTDKGGARKGRLESWVTQEDIASLSAWRSLFGDGFDACFVFLYWCDEQPPDALFQEVFAHRDRWYAVRAIRYDDYASCMAVRSVRWKTVHLPGADFERLSEPFIAMRTPAHA